MPGSLVTKGHDDAEWIEVFGTQFPGPMDNDYDLQFTYNSNTVEIQKGDVGIIVGTTIVKDVYENDEEEVLVIVGGCVGWFLKEDLRLVV